jgi:preprotein translocase subunit SecG
MGNPIRLYGTIPYTYGTYHTQDTFTTLSLIALCMGDDQNIPGPNEIESVLNHLRRFIAAHRTRLPSKSRARGHLITAAYGLLIAVNLIGVAAAQEGGGGGGGGGGGNIGSEVCGTAITATINGIAPIVLFVVVIGGLMLAYLLHAWSGFKKDPQQVQNIKNWRNRAGISAISAPLLGKALEIIIGIMGLGLAGCIDIVPGI